jgi:uncharacterized membrane-anchored protein
MNKQFIIKGLFAVIIFQVIILTSEYINAAYPLWTGQEIKLKTTPIDPRSLFRGNYARLKYEISEVPRNDITDSDNLRNGEVIYIKLKKNDSGLHQYSGASLNKPTDGLFIKGRIRNNRWDNSESLNISYGIEAFFAPKEKALALERDLRDTGVAEIMLATNGKAALRNVVPQTK